MHDRGARAWALVAALLASACDGGASHPATAVSAVWTHHNDNARTGAVLDERLLTTRNVDGTHFGLLFARPVDGQIYAQPLIVPRMTVPVGGKRDVVYVATQRNHVYAFDAVAPGEVEPLWEAQLGPPAASDKLDEPSCRGFLQPWVGITSTPVIDREHGTLFVEAMTAEEARYVHRGPAPGVLRAYDASDLGRLLWASDIDPRDSVGLWGKFTPPTVAGGRVYLATQSDRLLVYGLRDGSGAAVAAASP